MMDVNLPYLGSSESAGPSVDSINMSGSVGVLVATVPVTVPVNSSNSVESSPDLSFDVTTTEYDIQIGLTNKAEVRSGGAECVIAAKTTESDAPEIVTPYIMANTNEVHLDLSMTLTGVGAETIVQQLGDVTIQTRGDVHYHNLSYNMLNLFAITQRMPFFAGKIVGRSSFIEEFTMKSDTVENGDVVLNGSVLQGDDLASVDIHVPVKSFATGYFENLNMIGGVDVLNYTAISPVSSYAISLSIPINMNGKAEAGAEPEVSIEATINNIDVLLTAEVFDENAVRYEIADIDHGIASGKIKVFPNQWTLCFANKPVSDTGETETITSFFISSLIAKYGSDIHTKISMIVAKHPETGEDYNFVVQDGYITPEGSMNDFNMCYLKDGVYYPIPFMVQSVSDEILEIDWAV
jgi:hypothetical protein